MIKVTSTSDVDEATLKLFCQELEPDVGLSLVGNTIFLRSADPPSWIQIIGDPHWWIVGFFGGKMVSKTYDAAVDIVKGAVKTYVEEIAKEKAKQDWKDGKVHKFARSLVGLKHRIS